MRFVAHFCRLCRHLGHIVQHTSIGREQINVPFSPKTRIAVKYHSVVGYSAFNITFCEYWLILRDSMIVENHRPLLVPPSGSVALRKNGLLQQPRCVRLKRLKECGTFSSIIIYRLAAFHNSWMCSATAALARIELSDERPCGLPNAPDTPTLVQTCTFFSWSSFCQQDWRTDGGTRSPLYWLFYILPFPAPCHLSALAFPNPSPPRAPLGKKKEEEEKKPALKRQSKKLTGSSSSKGGTAPKW